MDYIHKSIPQVGPVQVLKVYLPYKLIKRIAFEFPSTFTICNLDAVYFNRLHPKVGRRSLRVHCSTGTTSTCSLIKLDPSFYVLLRSP